MGNQLERESPACGLAIRLAGKQTERPMRFRVTAQLPDPPGGFQIYAWSSPPDPLEERLQSLMPAVKWSPADNGWRAWIPDPSAQDLPPALTAAISHFSLPPSPWSIRDRTFLWGERTYLMGVLNVTPDSFSDGGQFNQLEQAVSRARYLVEAGADILDIGGESSRPGAQPVPAEEELRRVVPVIRALRELTDIPISIDTTKAEVLAAAIAAGADILNDISAGLLDPEMLATAAKLEVPVILMHMRGTPRTMQANPTYRDVIDDVYDYFIERISAAEAAGIARSRIAIDPGIGFGKTVEHNLSLIRRGIEFRSLGCPLLVGVSRKSFIGKLLNRPDPGDRVWGTGAACAVAIAQQADLLRVHDVAEIYDICQIGDRLLRSSSD